MPFDVETEKIVGQLTMPEIQEICSRHLTFGRCDRKSKKKMLTTICNMPLAVQREIVKSAEQHRSQKISPKKRPRAAIEEHEIKRRKLAGFGPSTTSKWEESNFMKIPSEEKVRDCQARFIDRTGNEALAKATCCVCGRSQFKTETQPKFISDILSSGLLVPSTSHPAHILRENQLFYEPAIKADGSTAICMECDQQLQKENVPSLSLANGMWLGDIPLELSILSLPERLLIAKYFPAAYIVKLYPKKKNAQFWDKETLQSGLRGNVSTFKLNVKDIAHLITGGTMPPPAQILSAMIGITFVGPRGQTLATLPDMFRVKRQNVRDALLWLKQNNPLYSDIVISEETLSQLPIDGIPVELSSTARLSDDVAMLAQEHADYVPQDEEINEVRSCNGKNNEKVADDGCAMDDISHDREGNREEDFDEDENMESDEELLTDPSVVPVHSMGVIDINADQVTDDDIMAHAMSNTSDQSAQIRRGNAFVNEYARVHPETLERTDGGSENPNHLLGAFPVLFPYGMGGFEVNRPKAVPYETHARWALQFSDKRFRHDHHFIFQIFGVIQKRQVCRHASLQVKRSTFVKQQDLFASLKASDLTRASAEETRKVPFTNPAVRALRGHITAVRSKVQGTDESRLSMRSQIWSTSLIKGPPSLWITINPADTQDPIAQVLAGADIDLDNFISTMSPDANNRTINIARDPYAAAEFFQVIIKAIIEELMGIKAGNKKAHIQRDDGIFGRVSSYIGTVEAQGRGTLHLHMMVWLEGSLTTDAMKDALQQEGFRTRVKLFIERNIKADLDGKTHEEIVLMKRANAVANSRPVDPRKPNYDTLAKEAEIRIARAAQFHVCSIQSCLKTVKGRLVCKRRAPFETAAVAFIKSNGLWGPMRLSGSLNNWIPIITLSARCNNDGKLVTNAEETTGISYYISNYNSKGRKTSSNVSALLAKRVAIHHKQERYNSDCSLINKRLVQRCANTLGRDQEFSGPEIINYLMGWGDRFISHRYEPIYWDSAVYALKRTFPELKGQSYRSTKESHSDVENSVETDDIVRLEVVDNQLVLRDQLKQYASRGPTLTDMSFFSFFIETYEESNTRKRPVDNVEGVHRGRPRSERVPYIPGSGRDKLCRVIRQAGHETLPQMIGRWLPSKYDTEQSDLYAASILLLLKPWRTLRELKTETESFDTSLSRFLQTASTFTLDIIANFQYYHNCANAANKTADYPDTTNVANEEEPEDVNPLPDIANVLPHLSEEDVATALQNRWPIRETRHGETAMAIAEDVGIFPADTSDTVFLGPKPVADHEKMTVYQQWEALVKNAKRKPGINDHTNANHPDERTFDGKPNSIEPHITSVKPLDLTVGPTSSLKADQRRAHNIIAKHLSAHLAGNREHQLLMFVTGAGGTGKTVLIKNVIQTFAKAGANHLLSTTATTGIAATLIDGQTLHSWAGIPINPLKGDNWMSAASNENKEKRKKNLGGKRYLIIDEVSMMTTELLALLSQVLAKHHSNVDAADAFKPFGGINLILFGDFHQFPPVGNPKAALYVTNQKRERGTLGRALFEQFETVVELKEQIRVTDPTWQAILDRLREGACSADDLRQIRKLLLSDETLERPDFMSPPWVDAVLVTPRHGVRTRWNTAALMKHCINSGERMFISVAEDSTGSEGLKPELGHRVTIAGLKTKETQNLETEVEVAVGMSVMVMSNVATDADLANGQRGTITGIVLDPRDHSTHMDEETAITRLKYPPAMIMFKPSKTSDIEIPGVPKGCVPLFPKEVKFSIKDINGITTKITRRQYPITPAFAFTDFKSQGQTIERVIIDLAKPPNGALSPFNAYVALSRSRGRENIRLLRDFDNALFTNHPSEDLRLEDVRLSALNAKTKLQNDVTSD